MERPSLPERKSPRLQGFDYSEPRCYFVTVCTWERRAVFTDARLNRAVLDLLATHAQDEQVILHAWCLMPDHLHLLLELPESGPSLSAWLGGFKSQTTLMAWTLGLHGRLWQGRFYDHILRQEESIERVADYIVHNPVRKGLVDEWVRYPWCGMSM